MNNVVNREMAVGEFERMCKNARIEFDTDRLNPEHVEDFNAMRADIIEAICDGALIIDVNGRATYITEDQKEFTFHDVTGGDFIRMDKYKANEDLHKGQAAAAAILRVEPKQLSVLPMDDWQFLIKVAGFFIGSKKRRSSRQRA